MPTEGEDRSEEMKHGRTLGAYGKLAVGGEAGMTKILLAATALVACLACTAAAQAQTAALDGAQVENLVRRSCPYVAMYNVNNKFDIEFPPVGKTDADVFGNNLLAKRTDDSGEAGFSVSHRPHRSAGS
jgi:hypothetical protein